MVHWAVTVPCRCYDCMHFCIGSDGRGNFELLMIHLTLVCRVQSSQTVLSERGWDHNAVFVNYNAVHGMEIVTELVVLLERIWQHVAEVRHACFNDAD